MKDDVFDNKVRVNIQSQYIAHMILLRGNLNHYHPLFISLHILEARATIRISYSAPRHDSMKPTAYQ
jgi:hypothetical protein